MELFISHVADPALPAADLTPRRVGRDAGPNLYASSVRSIRHGDVVDIDILDDVYLPLVLAETADRDAVGAVADEVLDEDIGGIGFE